MARNLTDLPYELLGLITKSLSHDERVKLSSTCSSFRALLVPSIFTRIKFTNSKRDADVCLELVGKFGEYIQEFNFVGSFPAKEDYPSDEDDSDDTQRIDGKLPSMEDPPQGDDNDDEDLEGLYRSKSTFPHESDKGLTRRMLPSNIELLLNPDEALGARLKAFDTISVHFQPDDDQEWASALWDSFYGDKTRETVGPPYQALMSRTWSLLSDNPKIKHLKIVECFPLLPTVWASQKFERFLGQLDSLEVSLWGEGNGAGWEANTVDDYYDFCSELNNVTQSLTSATSFKLESSFRSGPLGLTGQNYLPLPLVEDEMPRLRQLELVRCFVCPTLLRFLEVHGQMLLSLVLRDCYAEAPGLHLGEDGIWWSQFFEAVLSFDPVLSELSIPNRKIPLDRDEQFEEDYDPDEADEEEGVKEIRMVLRDPSSKRRLFSYAYLDDKYGMVFHDEEINVERFHNGDDQRAYDDLIRVVEKNAKKASKPDNQDGETVTR